MSNEKSGVYLFISKLNGKKYIGSTLDLESRYKSHIHNANRDTDNKQVIAHAIKKYGIKNFSYEVLEYCDKNMLIEREQYYLDLHEPFVDNDKGYNVRKIADNNSGITLSDNTKEKMSKASKGKPKSEKTKQTMRDVWHQSRTPEYYANLSARVSGDKNPAKRAEVRKKISKAMIGKTWKDDVARVEQHRTRSKVKMEQLWQNPAFKEKLKKTHLGAKRNDKSKEKMSAWQQLDYKLTHVSGTEHRLTSADLKPFCKEHNLGYGNLHYTKSNPGKTHKGWKLELIKNDK
jgi:group I intron endonuclease